MNKVGYLAYRKGPNGRVDKKPIGIVIADTTNRTSHEPYSGIYLVLLGKHTTGITGWTVEDCSKDDNERFKLIGKYMSDKSNRYWFFSPFGLEFEKGILNNE